LFFKIFHSFDEQSHESDGTLRGAWNFQGWFDYSARDNVGTHTVSIAPVRRTRWSSQSACTSEEKYFNLLHYRKIIEAYKPRTFITVNNASIREVQKSSLMCRYHDRIKNGSIGRTLVRYAYT